jgi:subtilisin family serine protease
MIRKPLWVALALLLGVASAPALEYVARAHPAGWDRVRSGLPPGAGIVEDSATLGLIRLELPPSALPALERLRRAGVLDWYEPNAAVVAMDLQGDALIWVDVLPEGTCSSVRDDYIQDQPAFLGANVSGLQAITDGCGVLIAVVDTGADYGHPDTSFTGQLLTGWDFVNEDGNAQDDHGHGTRVAGVVAAILPAADILPVKVLGTQATGTIYDVAEGIEWAADQGADVINISLGGPVDSQALRDAVSYAESQGALVVASAGNRDTSSPQYPAGIASVIAVAGVNGSDIRADFGDPGDIWASSYGSHVDVSAPALDVRTASWPEDFAQADGTSYSAALVSAIVAGQKAVGKTNAEAESDLEATAVDVDAVNPGFEGLLGSGRVDAGAAVE